MLNQLTNIMNNHINLCSFDSFSVILKRLLRRVTNLGVRVAIRFASITAHNDTRGLNRYNGIFGDNDDCHQRSAHHPAAAAAADGANAAPAAAVEGLHILAGVVDVCKIMHKYYRKRATWQKRRLANS